jgi:hypothetical protein
MTPAARDAVRAGVVYEAGSDEAIRYQRCIETATLPRLCSRVNPVGGVAITVEVV